MITRARLEELRSKIGKFYAISLPDLYDDIETLLDENEKLRNLLKRHYSFEKKCGHDFNCICLLDDSRSALERKE